MSGKLAHLWQQVEWGWAIWCGLLKNQTPFWDPYGAVFGAMILLLFVGLAVKFVRE